MQRNSVSSFNTVLSPRHLYTCNVYNTFQTFQNKVISNKRGRFSRFSFTTHINGKLSRYKILHLTHHLSHMLLWFNFHRSLFFFFFLSFHWPYSYLYTRWRFTNICKNQSNKQITLFFTFYFTFIEQQPIDVSSNQLTGCWLFFNFLKFSK